MPVTPFARSPLSDLVKEIAFLDSLPASFRFLVVDEGTLEAPTGVTLTGPLSGEAGLAEGRLRSVVVYGFDGRLARVIVGRSATRSEIVIRDRRVSGAHAAITPGGADASWVIDLSSSNGTFVDSRSLAPGDAGRAAIRPGASLALAQVKVGFLDVPRLRDLCASEAEFIKSRSVR